MLYPLFKDEELIDVGDYQRFVKDSCTPAYADYLTHLSLDRYSSEAMMLQTLRSATGLAAEIEEYLQLIDDNFDAEGLPYYCDSSISIDELVSEAGDVVFWYTALTYYQPQSFPELMSSTYQMHPTVDSVSPGIIASLGEKYTRKGADKYLINMMNYGKHFIDFILRDVAMRLYHRAAVVAEYRDPLETNALYDYLKLLRQANHNKLTNAPRIRKVD
jgi:hypothetical protein